MKNTIHVHLDARGHRLGYSAAGIAAPIGGTIAQVFARFRAQQNPQPVVASGITVEAPREVVLFYYDLPWLYDGGCDKCGRRVSTSRDVQVRDTSERGRQSVLVCSHCGQAHRP